MPVRESRFILFVLFIICQIPVSFSEAGNGPGNPPRVLAAPVRKVKSNNATVRLRANPISSEPPYFNLPRVDAGPNLIMEAGAENRILNGIPYGGSWSGPGVSPAGVFEPVSCGTFKLFYSVPDLGTDSVLCMVVGIGQNVNPPPVQLSGPDFICGNSAPVQFTGSPAGGTWSSNAGDGILNPGTLGGTLANISYTSVINGCTYTQSRTIPVYPAGLALQSSEEGNPCQGQSRTLSFDFQMPGEYQTEWYKNAVLVPGQTENFLQAAESGSYKAIIRPAGSTCALLTDSVTITAGSAGPPQPPALARNGNFIEMTNYSGSTGNKWYRNGELIAGQTASVITPVLSGIYHAVHSDGSCTSDYSNGILFQGVVTSAGQVQNVSYAVYPNPVSDFFRISHAEEIARIGITDMLGRQHKVRFGADGTVDMRQFGRGIYALEIRDKKGGLKKLVLVKQ
jgi:hypothetical protein